MEKPLLSVTDATIALFIHGPVYTVPSLFEGMTTIHEHIVFMDQILLKSAAVYVFTLTRTGVTVNVELRVNVVTVVAVQC